MKKIGYTLLAILLLILIFIGPWPISDEIFENTEYSKKTLSVIKKLTANHTSSKMNAGYAKQDITPPPLNPLGGYSARRPKNNEGLYEHVFVKAVTIQNSETTVTIVNSEILLALPKLVNAIVNKTHLKRHEIFFTSTHTHSGPGGYATSIIEQLTLGDYSEDYFQFLVLKHTKAILDSRENLTPAKIEYTNTILNDALTKKLIYNQLQPQKNGHSTLHLLQIIQANGKNVATLITFSAHPTFFGRKNKKISGDYPSLLTKKIEKQFGGGAMFIAGAVGGMTPIVNDRKSSSIPDLSEKQRHTYSNQLFKVVESALQHNDSIGRIETLKESAVSLNSFIVPIILPEPQFKLSDSLRISPFATKFMFHSSKSYIHVLAIGKLVFFAYPADYSGDLAKKLEIYAKKIGIDAWVTSFNGDYIGYLMPSEYYSIKHHITKDSIVYGKYSGDYFFAMSKKIAHQIKAP